MRKIQELREYENLEDTDTELEHSPDHDTEEVENTINKNVTIMITENRQVKKSMIKICSNTAVEAQTEQEVRIVIDTEEGSTNEPVEREMTKPSVETVNTEKEMHFDDLIITGDYINYDVLEEQQETISFNDIVWVKVKK